MIVPSFGTSPPCQTSLPKRSSHQFRLEDLAVTPNVEDVPFGLVAQDREARARELARLIDRWIVGDRFKIVEILSAEEQNATVRELKEIVKGDAGLVRCSGRVGVAARSEQAVVLRVRADLRPDHSVFHIGPECAIFAPNPHGPVAANLLEVKRGMTRVLAKQFVV